MERDFMGLSATVKEERHDEIYDADPVRSSGMRWSFPNKASAVPQLFSFQGAKEDKPKTGFESLASTGLVTITTSDSNQKSYSNILQQNTVPEKQLGGRYSAATFPLKRHDTHTVPRKVNSPTNLVSSSATSAASFAAISRQNLIGSLRPTHFGGVSMANPVPTTRSSGPLVGTTDLKTNTKVSEGPTQLTIFYRGSVCVYDNIPAEKAQAIMLLAGNGPPVTASEPPRTAAQASVPMLSVLDGFVVSKHFSPTPHHHSSPVPLSPVPINSVRVSHTASRSNGNIDRTTVKQSGMFISSSNKAGPMKAVNPVRSVPATNFVSSDTVPQFRRKSLARFLEKRKERVISTSPYADKKSPDCIMTGAGSTSLSPNSSGSCPAQPVN